MPAQQPFTQLCQRLARPRATGRADLHIHTTHSDGEYTPAQVVELALRSGLSAIAITDHDTMCAIPVARAAAPAELEVVSGVELTCEHDGHEVHLLGYFVALEHSGLNATLRTVRESRRDRVLSMVRRLRDDGVSIDDESLAAIGAVPSPSRRTLAAMLHAIGRAGSVREAFDRWLGGAELTKLPKARVPLATAMQMVREAGGVSSLAHPPEKLTLTELAAYREMGLNAIEADYPTHRAGRIERLRGWARELNLAVTGGSDCHGPDRAWRTIGASGVSKDELSKLRQLATN